MSRIFSKPVNREALMYKKTSQNIQRRTDNAKGKPQIDPSAFKSMAEFKDAAQELGNQRLALQQEIFLLNNRIDEAKRRAKRTGIYADITYFENLATERKNKVLALQTVERQQAALKMARIAFHSVDDLAFPVVFMKMAKTMLADDVYMRVFVSTSHFIEESDKMRGGKSDAA